PGGLAPSETAAPVLAWPGRGLAALAVIAFCALMAEGVINDWSAIFLSQTLDAGPGFAPLGYAVFSVTMIIGRLAGGPLTHHIRPARLMGLGGVIVAGGVLLCVAATNGAVALAGFAVIGLGLASVFPLAVSAAGRRRDRPPATAVAAVATAGYSGFLVGPAVVGLLASLFGLRAGLAVLVLLGALVAGLCLRRHPTGGVE
ncbi:MFS transporter, partial [Salinisphaera sp.]|uniref:MFS transporter n=1 Tax=Salinisphaera sp. TaxID=1914330 RepID=UPI002D785B8A